MWIGDGLYCLFRLPLKKNWWNSICANRGFLDGFSGFWGWSSVEPGVLTVDFVGRLLDRQRKLEIPPTNISAGQAVGNFSEKSRHPLLPRPLSISLFRVHAWNGPWSIPFARVQVQNRPWRNQPTLDPSPRTRLGTDQPLYRWRGQDFFEKNLPAGVVDALVDSSCTPTIL